MNPLDIPTGVMAMGTVPMRVAYPKQIPTAETMREILAHYWPAIEQHIRRQIADEINAVADRTSVDNIAMGGRVLGLRAAARIAAGNKHQPIATDITPDGDARQQNNHDAYTL